MENKDDLLNLNNNSKRDTKKLLMMGAGVFVLFVAGVIAFGLISNKKENNNVVVPPKQDNQLFKEVPIENQAPAQEETQQKSITQKLLQEENKPQQPVNQVEKPVQQPQPAPQPQPIQNNPVKPEVTKPSPAVEQQPAAKVETQKPKKEEKKEIAKHYYIQVAALMRYSKANPKFLKLIKKNGFDYKIVTLNIKRNNKEIQVKKVLVGPFTKKEAKEKLKIVKSKINQNAFIFRMK